jgi:hypothetical protein
MWEGLLQLLLYDASIPPARMLKNQRQGSSFCFLLREVQDRHPENKQNDDVALPSCNNGWRNLFNKLVILGDCRLGQMIAW